MKFKSFLNVAVSAFIAASFMIVGSATGSEIKITGAGASFPAPFTANGLKPLLKKTMAQSKWTTSPSVQVPASKILSATQLISVPVTQL